MTPLSSAFGGDILASATVGGAMYIGGALLRKMTEAIQVPQQVVRLAFPVGALGTNLLFTAFTEATASSPLATSAFRIATLAGASVIGAYSAYKIVEEQLIQRTPRTVQQQIYINSVKLTVGIATIAGFAGGVAADTPLLSQVGSFLVSYGISRNGMNMIKERLQGRA